MKRKSVTIRISESQYKNMIDAVIEEEMNKSEFIRESIQRQLQKIRRSNKRNLS